MPKLDVLVVGATGRQGGAVARALLQGGHHVRALTRNLAHPAADTLRLRGARLAWSDLDDERRLADVAAGVDAIFAVTTSQEKGPEAETRHGLLLTDLARRLGVAHLVYVSLPGAAALTGDRQLDAKHEVEQFLRASGVPHTIICPAFFMDNLATPYWLSCLRSGELSLPVAATQKLQQLARADLGRFVRVVLERAQEFVGRRVCIASDELTPIEMSASLARILGQRVQHAAVQAGTLAEQSPEHAPLFAPATQHATADVASLRRDYPEVNWHSLDGWARRQDWPALLRTG